MSNVLADDKHHQIVALGRMGWSLRRIERTTGVRRETVSGYLKAAGIVVPGRGRRASRAKPAISIAAVSTDSGGANPAISEAVSTDSEQAKAATRTEMSTDSVPSQHPGRAPSASACEPYRELIAEALGRGRNAMAIWQDLVDDHGFSARYASVRRFVVTLRGTSSPEARVVIMTAPGEEAQVDYGEGPMVRHPDTGKYRRTRLFVLTLGYSRKAVRLLVWQSNTQTWAELHERAFRRLGGTVRVIVLDNLKEGVLTPDIYDPALNPLYRDVLAYYGVVALPCRVGELMLRRSTYRDFGLVFARETGHPLLMNNLRQREFATLIKAANVRPIKFHGLRHTCATLLLQAGTPVHVVSERLGHSKVSMTMEVYAHVLPDMQQDAAAALGSLLHRPP